MPDDLFDDEPADIIRGLDHHARLGKLGAKPEQIDAVNDCFKELLLGKSSLEQLPARLATRLGVAAPTPAPVAPRPRPARAALADEPETSPADAAGVSEDAGTPWGGYTMSQLAELGDADGSPRAARPASRAHDSSGLSDDVRASIEECVAAYGGDKDSLRAELIEAHRADAAGATRR